MDVQLSRYNFYLPHLKRVYAVPCEPSLSSVFTCFARIVPEVSGLMHWQIKHNVNNIIFLRNLHEFVTLTPSFWQLVYFDKRIYNVPPESPQHIR